MSESHHANQGRREFVSRLASATAVAALLPVSTSTLRFDGHEGASETRRTNRTWDDSWTIRVRAATHKAVFDGPEISSGEVFDYAGRWLAGLHAALGISDADAAAVIVIRHTGITMALNDTLWGKYEFAKYSKLDDPTTGKLARRNPFLRIRKDDTHATIDAESSIESLRSRGAVLLACNDALEWVATQTAQETKQKPEDLKAEFHANLIPGVILQPNGVYATLRAQAAGCGFMRP